MQNESLQKLAEKRYFTTQDTAGVFQIKEPSARVLCSRYARKGIFLRLKKNFYVLDQNWKNFSREDLFSIANFLQVPSYISCMTALAFYEVTTQVQRAFTESVSLKRSVSYTIQGTVFNYYKIKRPYYFDFVKKGNVFIAAKEKAFFDMIYLYSFGKYAIDFSSLDLSKLDKQKLSGLIPAFPAKTQRIVKKICGI